MSEVVFGVDQNRSEMRFRATSNVHPIEGVGRGISGEVSMSLDQGEPDLSSPIEASVSLGVSDLRTGNIAYDTEIRRRLGEGSHPEVSGTLTSVERAGQGYRVTGDLTLVGRSRQLTIDMDVDIDDGETLTASWVQMIDIRDFGLKPPRVLMLKVDPEVEVQVELIGRAREDA